jgi:hypothetical protein
MALNKYLDIKLFRKIILNDELIFNLSRNVFIFISVAESLVRRISSFLGDLSSFHIVASANNENRTAIYWSSLYMKLKNANHLERLDFRGSALSIKRNTIDTIPENYH